MLYFCIISLTCLLTSCSSKKSIKKLTIPQRPAIILDQHNQTTPPSVTIWVHGTRLFRRPIFHSFFNGTPSLRLAKELAPDYYLRKIANSLCHINPYQFRLDTFYLFGWSGKLRAAVREQAAAILFKEIERVITEYKQRYHVTPYIRLITHSHGGTVALNLGKIKETEGQKFTINELILLACPVQESTCKYIEDAIFDHTLSLYSSLDMVQILAPQVIYNVFRTKKGHVRSRIHWPLHSYRRFQEHPKLSQLKIKINGRALFHTEFTGQRFISVLPSLIHVMNSWRTHQSMPHSTHLLCVYTHHVPVVTQVADAHFV